MYDKYTYINYTKVQKKEMANKNNYIFIKEFLQNYSEKKKFS